MSFHNGGKPIVTDGLVISLDASSDRSYPKSGNVWYDLSGNNTNAEIESSVEFLSGSYWGGFKTLNSKVNSNQSINGTINMSSAEYTFEIWLMKSQSLSDESAFGMHDGTVTSNGFRYNGGSFQCSNGGDWVDASLNYIAPLDAVAQLVLTRSGSNMNSYGNAIPAQNTLSANTGSGIFTAFKMNKYGFTGSLNGFGGNYYIIRIYNRALTAEEVLQNYNATKGRFL